MDFHRQILSTIQEIGFAGFLDMAILTFLIYTALVWFKRTRTASVLTGILIIAALYLFMRQLNLVMTTMIFEKFFAVFLVALVVIFQEELKSFFERVSRWSTSPREFARRREAPAEHREVGIVTRAVAEMAKARIGALIVVKGRDTLDRHIDGGIHINGAISEPLVRSLFDPSSPGHDGAMIVDGDAIRLFAAHVPLSRNLRDVGAHGTRHSAALGLSEHCDAMCVVVSEERGTISFARSGRLRRVTGAEELSVVLNRFLEEMHPVEKLKPWEEIAKRNFKEKLIALSLAVGLWFVNVHSSRVIYRSFTVPATTIEAPKDWNVREVSPRVVEVTFHGPRSAFFFMTDEDIKLLVKYQLQDGIQRIRLYSENLSYPKKFTFDYFDPLYVDVRLEKTSQPKPTQVAQPAAAE
ncbi:MAG: diadenylate cyclase [Candidatus Omnitrophica bacterium]|nr:diadenylate cyclase [Candidatus Omnitrophota bacterium]